LRAARDQHLQHFGKIGTGDIEQLAQEIEKEKEKPTKGDDAPGLLTAEDHVSVSPSQGASTVVAAAEESQQKDGEGDVKMEG